jgi:hypothetical protein
LDVPMRFPCWSCTSTPSLSSFCLIMYTLHTFAADVAGYATKREAKSFCASLRNFSLPVLLRIRRRRQQTCVTCT